MVQMHNGEAMGLTREQIFERNKRAKVRNIVVACSRISKKHPNEDFIDLMTAHIAVVLPTPLMRRLVKGDLGHPMREVMKLTIPFFA
jgi:hypothetical protein